MRWSASSGLLAAIAVAACHQPSQMSRVETSPPAPAPICPAIARTCDRSVADDWVMTEVQTRCWGCHAKGGSAGHDLVDLAAVKAAPIADMVGSCEMPPNGLSLVERTRIVQWASCTP